MNNKITPEDLVRWRDPDELLQALGAISREQKEELSSAVADLLDHEDPDIREEAVRRLIVQWKDAELRPTAIEILQFDEEPAVRRTAVYGLAALSKGSTQGEDTQMLLSILFDEAGEPDLRRAAYEALMMIHGRSDIPPVNREIDLVDDVDWTWIRSLAAAGGIETG